MKVKKHHVLFLVILVSLLLFIKHSISEVDHPSIFHSAAPFKNVQCYPHTLPRILMVVVTHDEDSQFRDLYREGPMLQKWHSCSGKQLEVTWKFSLEYTSPLYEGYIPYKLALESDNHGDMVETIETRYMLSRPRLRVLEEILTRFNWDFLVILKQDTVIDVASLLNQLPAPSKPFYGGYLDKFRDGTVYAKEELTVLSRITLANILSGLRFVVREQKNDPVTVGRIAAKLRIHPTQIAGGYNNTVGRCVEGAVYMTHANPRAISKAYKHAARYGSFC